MSELIGIVPGQWFSIEHLINNTYVAIPEDGLPEVPDTIIMPQELYDTLFPPSDAK